MIDENSLKQKNNSDVFGFLKGHLTLSEFLDTCSQSVSNVNFGTCNQNTWTPGRNDLSINEKKEIWILSLASDCRQFSFFLPILCFTKLGYQVKEVTIDPNDLRAIRSLIEDGFADIFAIILNPFFKDDVSILGKIQNVCNILNTFPSLIIGGPSIGARNVEKFFSSYRGDIYFSSQSLKAVKMIIDKFEGHDPMVFGEHSLKTEGKSTADSVISSNNSMITNLKPEKHEINLEICLSLINDKSLYQMHLKYKGNFLNDLKNNVKKAVELKKKVDKVKRDIILKKLISIEGYSSTVDVISKENSIFLRNEKYPLLTFPRQQKSPHKCLSDYVDNEHSKMSFFVVTSGTSWIDAARQLIMDKKYTEFMILQALAMQTAEAGAELIHRELNTMKECLSETNGESENETKEGNCVREKIPDSLVQGKRYSPGYSACPDLRLQIPLFSFFKDVTGISLTESLMMNPINSVSGFVFFKPECDYFSI
ncbi:hypothetical protein HOG98_01180 [bacterium]|nr:hypothetical protein [bacterium]